MSIWAYLIIETSKSSDYIPLTRDAQSGKVALADAAYSLYDAVSEKQYERTISEMVSTINAYGHLCGDWKETSLGVEWTTV